MIRLAVLLGMVVGVSACDGQRAEPAQTFIIKDDTILTPLSDARGDVSRGKTIFTTRDKGHCILCHKVSGLDADFQGDVGPDLSAIEKRVSAAQIRLRIVDASQLNPNTVMPPYFRTQGLRQVAPEYEGKTVLSAQDIEDLIAYLMSAKG